MGPKTKAFLESRRNPQGSVYAFMKAMEEMAREKAQEAVGAFLDGIRGKVEQSVADFLRTLRSEGEATIHQEKEKLPETIRMAIRTEIESLPHLKGDPGDDGYAPVKGKDYGDGAPGYTPVADVDYPSSATVRSIVDEYANTVLERLSSAGVSETQMKLAFSDMFAEALSWQKVARGLETLHGADRLDYEALKNRPGVPVEGGKQHTLNRGGSAGKQTYTYDLSGLCDGNTKAFAVPANSRILQVVGTDSPAGAYRKDVDWTGSGTPMLTLTNAVAAPTLGATLYILYVQ